MSAELARRDDLLLLDHPAQDVEIKGTFSVPAERRGIFPMIFLIVAAGVTVLWATFLGWVLTQFIISFF